MTYRPNVMPKLLILVRDATSRSFPALFNLLRYLGNIQSCKLVRYSHQALHGLLTCLLAMVTKYAEVLPTLACYVMGILLLCTSSTA